MPLAEPKEKIERRIGERLFLKGERSFSQKAAVFRRPYPPGQHGKRTRRGGGSKSEFGAQLKEKQKVRYLYGLSDRILKNYFGLALKSRTKSTSEILAETLERRLDNVVFRSGLAISRSIARHLVSYGHVQVNGKKIRQPSFRTKIGDTITINPTSISLELFKDIDVRLKKHSPPEWLELNKESKAASVLRLPGLRDISTQQNIAAVVEYYSK